MPLPDPIRDFFYAYESLAATTVRTEWGIVVTDPRFPDVYDANKAMVLEPAPSLTLEDMRSALIPALDSAAIRFEHVEFMDLDDLVPAAAQAEEACGFSQPDAVMVFEGPRAAAADSEAVVREETDPDEDFWRTYMQSRGEFGIEMPQDVYRQLVERDRTVFAPAGTRIFAGYLDDRLAGFASLLSIGEVGYVDNVVTLQPFRRRGVASAVVSAIVRASAAAGNRTTFLLTELGSPAQSLYQGLGFGVAGQANGYTRPRSGPAGDPYV